jgi:hypothetical protein
MTSPHHAPPAPRRTVPQSLYVEAPNYYRRQVVDPPSVFIAGGITGVQPWHHQPVDALMSAARPVVVFNPNRADFPIGDPAAGWEQVSWEQHYLHLADLTMMWFPAADPAVTTCPIAMYELGQAIGEDRELVVGADPGYPRRADVHMLCQIGRPGMPVYEHLDDLIVATLAHPALNPS